ncbi:hypothetical protein DLJ53_18385 [Acuticoccus sediminis]|uniref:Uncharacterized protein n=1 Tax=Acuticoccus sediminis TaxID=2184697 RepID=A0A8B2NRK8_9HYPH|nr:hypothetical protein [Acuticoccus sediminis]RAH99733.1 hypothetical protein DLJ53_18385 [Acuticoccus sediminis]
MALTRSDRRESFHGLWPWPGNIFVVLFGAWTFYMASQAETQDVQTAFYGLTGLAALVLLLGLRTIGRRREGAVEPAAVRTTPRAEEVSFTPRERMPQNATMRTESAATARPATPPPVENRGAGPGVDAMINREKAARGAQIAKLESTVNERLAMIEARLGAGSGNGSVPVLDEYLRIETFNAAINERLLPRIKEMISAAITERMTPDALRSAVGGAAPGAVAEEVARLRSSQDIDHRELEALRSAIEAGQGGGEGGQGVAAMTARLQTLEKTLEAQKRDLEVLAGSMRETVTDVGRQLKHVDEVVADVLRRLEQLDGQGGGDGARTPADISQLRDALATIIEQNRDIKARQEMLTARFQTPSGDAAKE